MKPENRALLVVFVALAVVVAAGGVYLFTVPLLTVPSIPSSSLPIPVGTLIPRNVSDTWVVHFSVTSEGSRLVGAWTAYTSRGGSLLVANGTLAPPGPAVACPSYVHMPDELNGTFDTPLDPGAYTIFVESCSVVSQIVITETIQVVTTRFLG